DFIVGHVEKATGRSFAISGRIDLSYYPWLGVEAGGITLGNAKGFGDTPFLHAESVALRIKTMPLLKKHYELDTLRVHGLQLHLARNKDGSDNWSDLAKPAPEEEKEPGVPIAAVVLGGVDIKKGQITWQDQTADQTITISDLNVTTGELTYGAPINLAATMKAAAAKPAMVGDVNLKGTLNYNLDSGIYAFKPIDLVAKLSGKSVPGGATDLIFKAAVESNLKEDTARLEDLSLDVLGASVKGGLTAAHVKSGKPQVQGDLSIKGKDLAQLLKLIESPAAKDLERLADRSFDIRANLSTDLQSGTLQVPKFEAVLLGASIKGNVDARDIQSKTPGAKGMIKASGPDLPALLQIAGQFETGKDPKLVEYGRKLAKAQDRAFDIAAEFDADLKSGNIQVPMLAAKTLGFTVDGQLVAKDMNSDQGKVDGKFSLKGEKPADVLAALGQPALAEVLQVVSVDAGVSGTGGEVALRPLRVKATFSGKQIPQSPADVLLNADTIFNLKKQTVVMQNMTLQGLGVDVAGDLAASKVQTDTPVVNGKITARGDDLALLFKLAGIEPLASQIAALSSRSFAIKSGLDADIGAGTVKVKDLDARLLGATIQGQVDASNIRSKSPSARGKLKAAGPDLPALMQVIGQFQGKDSALKVYGERLAQVSGKSFDVTAEFDAAPDKGNYRVPALAAKAFGINLNGQLDANAINSSSGKIDGKFSLVGEQLAGVLAAVGQSALGEVLQSVKMDAGVKGQGGDIALSPLQFKATFAGKQIPNSPVDLTLSADTRANLDKQTLSVNKLALQGLGLNVT
ncbi:MAG: AsmA family protein, partial [Gammaproteobacteria bacterium]